MENEIFRTISDHIGMITSIDVLSVLCDKYKVNSNVKRTSITILYLIQMYYDSLKFSVNAQAFSAFFISLYCLGQTNVIEDVRREGDCLVDIKIIDTMHSGILKFSTAFPSFTNPMRFLGFDFNLQPTGELFVFRHNPRFE